MAFKVFFLIATMMILTLTLTLTLNLRSNEKPAKEIASKEQTMVKLPKRASRFLLEQRTNPRSADHCNKDNAICYILEGKNSTCCNNKCMDMTTDKNNCGACKNKCKKYTDSCCGGQCVDLSYDTSNCGACGNKCMPGAYCLKGMCDYA